MERKIEETKERGDTLGGIVEILVRGVEIGAGFEVARMLVSQCNDPLGPEGFEKNDAGGILGGISNGDDLLLRVVVKPVPSIHLE